MLSGCFQLKVTRAVLIQDKLICAECTHMKLAPHWKQAINSFLSHLNHDTRNDVLAMKTLTFRSTDKVQPFTNSQVDWQFDRLKWSAMNAWMIISNKKSRHERQNKRCQIHAIANRLTHWLIHFTHSKKISDSLQHKQREKSNRQPWDIKSRTIEIHFREIATSKPKTHVTS